MKKDLYRLAETGNCWITPDYDEDHSLDIYTDKAEEIEYHSGKGDDYEFGTLKLEYHDDEDEETGETQRWWRGFDSYDSTVTPWWADKHYTIAEMDARKEELQGEEEDDEDDEE